MVRWNQLCILEDSHVRLFGEYLDLRFWTFAQTRITLFWRLELVRTKFTNMTPIARNALFACLSIPEFERVSSFETTHEI